MYHYRADFWVLTAVCCVLAGCSSLSDIGQEPQITPTGQPRMAVPQPALEQIPSPQYSQSYMRHQQNKAYSLPQDGLQNASLWRSGPESLFGDRRARQVGDILTVNIEINDKAEFNNKTTRTRSGAEDLSISGLFGLDTIAKRILPDGTSLEPAVGTDSSTTTSGDGKINRRERIELKIAAIVTDILPNGNMVIKGSQEVRVNYELRDLQISGIVRPSDISRQNTIGYEKIAEARISYGGRGTLYNIQQPRYGQQFLDKVLPF